MRLDALPHLTQFQRRVDDVSALSAEIYQAGKLLDFQFVHGGINGTFVVLFEPEFGGAAMEVRVLLQEAGRDWPTPIAQYEEIGVSASGDDDDADVDKDIYTAFIDVTNGFPAALTATCDPTAAAGDDVACSVKALDAWGNPPRPLASASDQIVLVATGGATTVTVRATPRTDALVSADGGLVRLSELGLFGFVLPALMAAGSYDVAAYYCERAEGCGTPAVEKRFVTVESATAGAFVVAPGAVAQNVSSADCEANVTVNAALACRVALREFWQRGLLI